MIIFKWIQKHPTLSGIIAIAVCSMGCYAVLLPSISVDGINAMIFVWMLVMGISGVAFVVSGIVILLKAEYSPKWTTMLLWALWVLVVGGGTCASVLVGIASIVVG